MNNIMGMSTEISSYVYISMNLTYLNKKHESSNFTLKSLLL